MYTYKWLTKEFTLKRCDNMKFEIMSRTKARGESFKVENMPTAIISIKDHWRFDNKFDSPDWIVGILYLSFDDEEFPHPNCMKEDDAKNIFKFIQRMIDKNVERIIVHCEAGISRSAGVAAAIMKAVNGDDMDIFNNPKFCPNMTCYRLTLNQFFDNPNEEEIKEKERHNFEIWEKENNFN